ncbi:MAG: peptidoglycan-binding protein [Treponema sp.]|nr:peptidoglycan-binding protein [Treponema sp.]
MRHIIDDLYDAMGEETSFFSYIKNSAHLIMCPACSKEARALKLAETTMKDFFPPFPLAPDFEESLMERIDALPDMPAYEAGHLTEVPLRGWVIIGVFMLFSLTTLFFGIDFEKVASSQGQAFLLPVGIIIGGVVTGYGALFIGSHLKELSERFGLR